MTDSAEPSATIELIGIARRTVRHGPMQAVEHSAITCAGGIAGDLRGKPGKRQVTLLSEAAWQAACQQAGANLDWTARRANLLVRNRAFSADDIGKTVTIGEATLTITRETDPCAKMDKAHNGLQAALADDFRGGVCCRVLTDGEIAIGDALDIS